MQEFAIKLFEALEVKMKGVVGIEGELNKLMEGTVTNYIKCLNVDYESLRDETFNFVRL